MQILTFRETAPGWVQSGLESGLLKIKFKCNLAHRKLKPMSGGAITNCDPNCSDN